MSHSLHSLAFQEKFKKKASNSVLLGTSIQEQILIHRSGSITEEHFTLCRVQRLNLRTGFPEILVQTL